MDKSLVIAGMAIVTYLTRYSMMALFSGDKFSRDIPPFVRRWLDHVPTAIFAALVFPAVLAPDGRVSAGPYLWSALGALPVAWKTKSALSTIVAGVAVFWALKLARGS